MSKTALFAGALAALATALSAGAASAGGYGGFVPYSQPGYEEPCCAYNPPPPVVVPHFAPAYPSPVPQLPPPVFNLPEGPKYYYGYGNGYGTTATHCYRQSVRVPDARGGWTWGVKSSCDSR